MKSFARLLESLVYTTSRNEKLRLLDQYFRETPDPDRGWALAAIAGTLDLPSVTPARVRAMVEARVDPHLFRLSYDYVGDLAETVSLIWPVHEQAGDEQTRNEQVGRIASPDITVDDAVRQLRATHRNSLSPVLGALLDRLDPSARFALLKLTMGGLRVGVSARLVKRALANFGNKPVETIEELWFGLSPPYGDLFAWLEGRGPEPNVDRNILFRPVMLAHPLEEEDLEKLDPADFQAEWKWDGIRVQAVSLGGKRRLYTRTGEDIGHAFADVIDAMTWQGVIDGELLVVRNGRVQPFDQLQKRLGRKQPSAKLMLENPAHIRAYDLLEEPDQDLRGLAFQDRRKRLESWFDKAAPQNLDLSDVLTIADWDGLQSLRAACRATGLEGVMVKRRDSPYLAGRVKGHWFKWKRDPLTADCVLMYAQRGHGKRSSYYSDYTFGCWAPAPEDQGEAENGQNQASQATSGTKAPRGRRLVPVGKAYSGYTDAELLKLDKFVRDNTIDRFGPVRAVALELVLEVAFDAVQSSTRHKSGIAMRFPRIKRIRWDKPAAEADMVAGLARLIEGTADER